MPRLFRFAVEAARAQITFFGPREFLRYANSAHGHEIVSLAESLGTIYRQIVDAGLEDRIGSCLAATAILREAETALSLAVNWRECAIAGWRASAIVSGESAPRRCGGASIANNATPVTLRKNRSIA